MTDRTAAALAAALPAGIRYFVDLDLHKQRIWRAQEIADFQARKLAESGWRLVHADEHSHPCTCQYRPPQTFAEHTAEALALIHDHVEVSE